MSQTVSSLQDLCGSFDWNTSVKPLLTASHNNFAFNDMLKLARSIEVKYKFCLYTRCKRQSKFSNLVPTIYLNMTVTLNRSILRSSHFRRTIFHRIFRMVISSFKYISIDLLYLGILFVWIFSPGKSDPDYFGRVSGSSWFYSQSSRKALWPDFSNIGSNFKIWVTYLIRQSVKTLNFKFRNNC